MGGCGLTAGSVGVRPGSPQGKPHHRGAPGLGEHVRHAYSDRGMRQEWTGKSGMKIMINAEGDDSVLWGQCRVPRLRRKERQQSRRIDSSRARVGARRWLGGGGLVLTRAEALERERGKQCTGGNDVDGSPRTNGCLAPKVLIDPSFLELLTSRLAAKEAAARS
jgi:hypothetical protein